MSKNLSILLFLSIFLINCNNDITQPETTYMSIEIGEDPLEITPIYYKNNEDYYLDDVSLDVESNNLLQNKFDLDFKGSYGENVIFTPKEPGIYDIKLIVRDILNGKQIDITNYRIDVSGSPLSSEFDSKSINSSAESVPTENLEPQNTPIKKNRLKQKLVTVTEEKLSSSNFVYYLQISAWSKEKDAILSKIDLVKSGKNPFIEKFDKNGVSFWRVRLGPFKSYEDAKKESDDLNLDSSWIEKVANKEIEDKTIEVENLISYEDEKNKTIEVENLISYEDEKNKTIEVENLISYEDEKNKTIEVENLISYEDEKNKTIEVENLISYEDEKNKTIEVENLISYEDEKNKTIEVENLISYEAYQMKKTKP